ncbi:hypothetical protein [Paenibacillus periandrae]|nr:hypothetical protein [Paenibacillus periandrae]
MKLNITPEAEAERLLRLQDKPGWGVTFSQEWLDKAQYQISSKE